MGYLFLAFVPQAQAQAGYEITRQMFAETQNIGTLTYTMNKQERIDGELVEQHSFTKLMREPYKVYTRQLYPDEGIEVLYIPAKNDQALINPDGFPYVNIRLDPYGSTMRADQHHTIHNAGYDYFISILQHLFEKHGEETKQMAQQTGTTTFDGHPVSVVEFRNPHFRFEDYTVQQGETLLTIAKDRKVSEYMILNRNEDVDSYTDVSPGQVIQVPSDYSPRMILYIDQQRHIPLMIKVYDDEGLYEQYEFTDVAINPSLSEEEFTEDYSEYGF